MTSESPTNHAPEDEMEDAPQGDDSDGEDFNDDSSAVDASGQKPSKSTAPVQKRRRVTRACDECRRKKIKCDGKQPCTHCTVYSYGRCRNQCPSFY